MEKIKIRFEDNIAETLLIPLWMRVQESSRKDALIHDSCSQQLVEQLDYDFSKFSSDTKSQVGVALRTRYLDHVVQKFVDENPNPVVVLGGCGLDPRPARVHAQQSYICYELDLPEVIDYRKKLLPPTDNELLLPISLFDTQWMKNLAHEHPNAQFLVVVEGVLMYFEEETVRQFFVNVGTYLSGTHLYVERMGKMFSHNTKHHSSVRNTKAQFAWGCDKPEEMLSWHKSVHLEDTYYFMKDAPMRVGIAGMIAKLFFWRMCGIWGFKFE